MGIWLIACKKLSDTVWAMMEFKFQLYFDIFVSSPALYSRRCGDAEVCTNSKNSPCFLMMRPCHVNLPFRSPPQIYFKPRFSAFLRSCWLVAVPWCESWLVAIDVFIDCPAVGRRFKGGWLPHEELTPWRIFPCSWLVRLGNGEVITSI